MEPEQIVSKSLEIIRKYLVDTISLCKTHHRDWQCYKLSIILDEVAHQLRQMKEVGRGMEDAPAQGEEGGK